MKPTVVLWVGGGQDSSALIYRFALDNDFKKEFIGDADWIAVMADTGDEYPDTYQQVQYLQQFAIKNKIEFYFITPNMGYHPKTWHSLSSQMERNNSIFSVAFPKSCTDKLKVSVCYNFLEDYLKKKYGFEGKKKKAFYEYHAKFGKLKSFIGFAKGEESRKKVCDSDKIVNDIPIYRQKCTFTEYPLIQIGWNRQDCQEYIKSTKLRLPMPSNCMMCPFQNEAEIVYLHRFFPDKFKYWVEREQAKLLKNRDKEKNLGVKGKVNLPEYLEKALVKYGHWTNDELAHYKNSHGHCVMSKY